MKVKVPREITIGCHRYRVSFNEIVDHDGHDATAQHRLQQLWFAPGIPDSRKNVALLHEVIHVICNVFNVDLGGDGVVDSVAQGIGELLFREMGIELDWSDVPTLVVSEDGQR